MKVYVITTLGRDYYDQEQHWAIFSTREQAEYVLDTIADYANRYINAQRNLNVALSTAREQAKKLWNFKEYGYRVFDKPEFQNYIKEQTRVEQEILDSIKYPFGLDEYNITNDFDIEEWEVDELTI